MPDTPDHDHRGGHQVDHKPIDVALVWGGTGVSHDAVAKPKDTAAEVFEALYKRFKQTASNEDTYQVGRVDFPRDRFGETVQQLAAKFPDNRPLEFEVMPPTSGA